MVDELDEANKKVGNTSSTPVQPPQSKKEVTKKLPRVKSKELVEREKEAEAQSSKAESDRITLLQKEEVDVEIKKKIFTDNPQEYPKIEKYVDMCVKINEVRDERNKTSSENVKKSKKAFTFPIKKVTNNKPQPEAGPPPDVPPIPLL